MPAAMSPPRRNPFGGARFAGRNASCSVNLGGRHGKAGIIRSARSADGDWSRFLIEPIQALLASGGATGNCLGMADHAFSLDPGGPAAAGSAHGVPDGKSAGSGRRGSVRVYVERG